MIVDTSALVTVAAGEPEADRFLELLRSEPVRVAAATYLECSIVLDRRRSPAVDGDLDALLTAIDAVVEPFTADQASLARRAYREFGKGSGHPAQLNLGDCFAYALAIQSGEPLLFKGDDFGHTGISSAT